MLLTLNREYIETTRGANLENDSHPQSYKTGIEKYSHLKRSERPVRVCSDNGAGMFRGQRVLVR